jgi:HlyD family secretion protein
VSGEPRVGVPSAHAQGLIRNLIARLRGETLPDGIVKSNGRIEATQLDVSSKYAGRLSEVTVDEGQSVTKGQVIAKLTSPEYDAQLRAAQANVQSGTNALAAAEAEITSRQSQLDFSKADLARGQELIKTGFITSKPSINGGETSTQPPRRSQPRRRSAIRPSRRSRTRRRKSSGYSRSSLI